MKEIEFFTLNNKKAVIEEWLFSLSSEYRARIYARFSRLKEGNFGDFKKIDKNISELRFNFGSGYRIYYTEVNNIIILLLNGGDKSTQKKDIKKANEYFEIWKEQQNEKI